ncbi:Uncharacterized protein TCM_017283 [Theobroma cacao]|uniref:Uncharacterized protein n=1 Tax=Theobroma cacao TaxID=3641 RepID=A0A061ED73_THECC|nr:Uncharacterized protein TCM_017283 [Theobroma cacao]
MSKLTPNEANSLDMENHSWGQNLQEVSVSIPVPHGTRSRCHVGFYRHPNRAALGSPLAWLPNPSQPSMPNS